MDLHIASRQRPPADKGAALQRPIVKLRLAHQLLEVALLFNKMAGDGIDTRHPRRLRDTVALNKLLAIFARLRRLAEPVGWGVHIEAGITRQRIVLVRHRRVYSV